jgi:hypothetical protein
MHPGLNVSPPRIINKLRSRYGEEYGDQPQPPRPWIIPARAHSSAIYRAVIVVGIGPDL